MISIRKKETLSPAMHVMKCPQCGAICASASEKEWLPSKTWCSCDEKEK